MRTVPEAKQMLVPFLFLLSFFPCHSTRGYDNLSFSDGLCCKIIKQFYRPSKGKNKANFYGLKSLIWHYLWVSWDGYEKRTCFLEKQMKTSTWTNIRLHKDKKIFVFWILYLILLANHPKEQVSVPVETSNFFTWRNNQPLSPSDLQATDE